MTISMMGDHTTTWLFAVGLCVLVLEWRVSQRRFSRLELVLGLCAVLLGYVALVGPTGSTGREFVGSAGGIDAARPVPLPSGPMSAGERQAIIELPGASRAKLERIIANYGEPAAIFAWRFRPARDFKQLKAVAKTRAGRVHEPVEGLYASIPTGPQPPPAWNYPGQLLIPWGSRPDSLDALDHLLAIEDPSGKPGHMQRSWFEPEGHLKMNGIWLEEMQRWMPHEPALVPGRGIPTATYMNLYAMRRLGIEPGQVKRVIMAGIGNHQTIAQLGYLRSRYPDASLDQLAVHTHSIGYIEAPLTQSGHRIESGVDPLRRARSRVFSHS